VVDRGEPEAPRSEWHADGTAGEDDCGSGLAVKAPAQAMGETRPGRREPRWQAPPGVRQRARSVGHEHHKRQAGRSDAPCDLPAALGGEEDGA
jgi:hypothetical protein